MSAVAISTSAGSDGLALVTLILKLCDAVPPAGGTAGGGVVSGLFTLVLAGGVLLATAPLSLPAGSTTLTSNNAHVYTDVNANNVADPSEEVSPAGDGSYSFAFMTFTSPPNPVSNNCSVQYVCSWRSQFPQGSSSCSPK